MADNEDVEDPELCQYTMMRFHRNKLTPQFERFSIPFHQVSAMKNSAQRRTDQINARGD